MINVKKEYEESGIELDIKKRWEEGIEHNPKSKELMEHLIVIDYYYCDDHHGFKTGGDGDNGEALMYLLDIYFDRKDKLNEG
ncbi:MAG: hypothetical protein ACYSSI_12980 [Planctomycetota bacterium]|jgi:hypothetical protein